MFLQVLLTVPIVFLSPISPLALPAPTVKFAMKQLNIFFGTVRDGHTFELDTLS